MKEQAIRYLSQNVPLHIDMLEALRRHDVPVLYVSDRACLLQTRHKGMAQLACDDADAGEAALRAAGELYLVVSHGKAAWDAVKRVYPTYDSRRPCHQAYYPSRTPHEVPPTCTIAPYPMDRLDDVMTHYDNVNDPAYIIDRIEKGDLFAGYLDGELCGFIGFHNDGSMGMLEVFPDFRRHHVGFALEQNLINEALRRGWVPYCHIYEGNTPSVNLQKKLGLHVTEDCCVAWMHAPRD